MRWPAGWRDPAKLSILRGTPINCVVPAEAEAPSPAFTEAAPKAGVKVLAAEDASVAWAERSKAPWKGTAQVLALTDGVWPGVPMVRGGGGGGGQGGPTGMPWVDSNGWLIQLASALAPRKTIWIAADPPAKDPVRQGAYPLAVADAAAYGARWVVSLDKELVAGIDSGAQAALDTWKSIGSTLAFFEQRREWRGQAPVAVVGVISDFAPPNDDLSCEILNLLERRAAPYKVIPRAEAGALPFAGFKALIYADTQAPEQALKAKLEAFVRAGGLLMAGMKYPAAAATGPVTSDTYRRYSIRKVGLGRIALAVEEAQDPYLVAADSQLILSRRYDVLRFFNSGTLNSRYTAAPGGAKALLQVLNYATRRSSDLVSVALAKKYRAARLMTLDSPTPAALELRPAANGCEVWLPPFGTYVAVELEA